MAVTGERVGALLRSRGPLVILVGVALYYAVWGGEYSAFDIYRLHGQRSDAADQLADSRQQVDSLRVLARRLTSDPATIEAVARERFGMIRDGELLYRFVQVDPDTGSTATRVSVRTP